MGSITKEIGREELMVIRAQSKELKEPRSFVNWTRS
jgi:hypothetical protein